DDIWERDTVVKLVEDDQLMGYRHHGFWSCMDTVKERNFLEDLWNANNAPWKIWDHPDRT
ncbi:MAG: glucose-1-phosphate cytidylyltransferase, partial [Dehalococcoidia bacterium]